MGWRVARVLEGEGLLVEFEAVEGMPAASMGVCGVDLVAGSSWVVLGEEGGDEA